MSNQGSGQGTPIPYPPTTHPPYDPTEELGVTPNCAVSLPRYAKLVGYDEAAMWGVVYENQHLNNSCATLWDEAGRSRLQNALAIAQQMLEQFIGYPLCPTWVTGTLEEHQCDFRWTDSQNFKHSTRFVTRYPRVIAPGVRAVDIIDANAPVDYSSVEGLGLVGALPVTFTDPNEVVVTYPDSGRRIYPSRVYITGGNLYIEIPRFRMVDPDLLNTPEGGIMYDNLNNFLATVTVLRVHNDPSHQGVLVRPNCTNNNCDGSCDECTHDACIYVRDPWIGHVDIHPATWDGTALTWNPSRLCGTGYNLVRLNYLCGLKCLNLETENVIVHLAHTLLNTPPCSCDWLFAMWECDREYSNIMTREMLNNPFGRANGALSAYAWAKTIASVRAGIL